MCKFTLLERLRFLSFVRSNDDEFLKVKIPKVITRNLPSVHRIVEQVQVMQ